MHAPPTLDELEQCRQKLIENIDSEKIVGDSDTKEIRTSKRALKEIEETIKELRARN
jgi:hypothetical protein